MPVSRKPKPQPFQLKPKHLVTAVLSVCAAAIVAVIVGVVGTFNSHDKARPIEAQPKDETGTGRVEVLKPEGSGAVPAGGIVINPNAGGQHPTGITDDRMVPPAPINSGSPAVADSGSARQQPAPRSNASEADAGPNQPAAAKQDKPDNQAVTPPPPPQNEQPEPETRKEPPKPEPEPSAETKPAPEQAKPQSQQQKEEMDELF